MCRAVEQSIKKMILKAVPDLYINVLADELLGYAGVSFCDLIEHLITTCGTIDEDEFAANLERMASPWDPSGPTVTVFTQARKCRQIATAGGDAISDATSVRLCRICSSKWDANALL